MQSPASPTGTGRATLRAALLDFQRLPGKHPVHQREPGMLFASLREILQLAAGRQTEGSSDEIALRNAACFFVRSALIYPQADHYSLLGLAPDSDIATIKDHYRLLMRLTHPDFSGTSPDWPPDAAVRLNLAYQVLSSPEQRATYDAERAPPPRPGPRKSRAGARRPGQQPPSASTRMDSRRLLRRLAAAFGVAGSLALSAFLFLGGNELDNLVQRPVSRASETPSDAQSLRMAVVQAASPADTALQPVQDSARLQPQDAGGHPATTPTTAPAAVAAPANSGGMPSGAASALSVPAPPVLAPTPPAAPAAAEPAPSTQAPPAITDPIPAPAPTLAEVHPLLSRLLQQLESGGGDRVLSMLDADARGNPAAQELVRYYNSLVAGAGPVKVFNVQFKAEPHGGRLVVTGNVRMSGTLQRAAHHHDLSVQAEFATRAGVIVMTRLARAE